jgi:hypothetical protein
LETVSPLELGTLKEAGGNSFITKFRKTENIINQIFKKCPNYFSFYAGIENHLSLKK